LISNTKYIQYLVCLNFPKKHRHAEVIKKKEIILQYADTKKICQILYNVKHM